MLPEPPRSAYHDRSLRMHSLPRYVSSKWLALGYATRWNRMCYDRWQPQVSALTACSEKIVSSVSQFSSFKGKTELLRFKNPSSVGCVIHLVLRAIGKSKVENGRLGSRRSQVVAFDDPFVVAGE